MPRRFATIVLASLLLCASIPAAAFAQVDSGDAIDGIPYAERGLDASQMPDLDVVAGILVADDGTLIWSRLPDEKLPIASITKVMTALVALEVGEARGTLDTTYTISSTATTRSSVESTAWLTPGMKLTLRELIEMTIVWSGNDAAAAVAEAVAGTQEAFVELMNDKASEIGMNDTLFTNPHGLDEGGNHSTARDVATLVTHAMQNDEFRRIVALQYLNDQAGTPFRSSNELLFMFDGANGVKTGSTDAAGYCLASSATRGEIELYGVVLGAMTSTERFAESATLLEFGFAHYAPREVFGADTELTKVPVRNYRDRALRAGVQEPVIVASNDLLGPVEHEVVVDPAFARAPVSTGTVVGWIDLSQNGEALVRLPLVSLEDIEKPGIFERIGAFFVHTYRSIFGENGEG
ncbi:MAG: D-alanyl-D-alanine carboxypeptidase [Coriobacteriia bacterium]|nr:D-alanyl-D-alanine carboxypeptidase [Coriobacteriia bacterium]